MFPSHPPTASNRCCRWYLRQPPSRHQCGPEVRFRVTTHEHTAGGASKQVHAAEPLQVPGSRLPTSPKIMWRVRLWRWSQIEHLRPREAHAQIYPAVQSYGQFDDQQCGTSLHPVNQRSMSVRESEMSEIKKCVCTVAHRGRRTKDFSVARLNKCFQSPSVRNLAEQNKVLPERNLTACHCECAVHTSAEKTCGW